ncbi:MAG: DUF2807 domain-containing protein [Bacteroidales bacterium]|nr:DUF2807 domain-containing protein [Lentimicrobiaceae bacterium]MDD5694529.1 DUF2807 domain-containing protein [Bacteroidales bacterium]
MKTWKHILWLFPISWLLIGCEKIPGEDCFKSTGETTVEHRTVGPFEHINLENNINLILTQGDDYAVMVRAGKNLIGSIITEVNDNVITVRNDNKCNWVRDFNDDIDVYLTVKNLCSITYRSSGLILSTNTIISDSLNIAVWDGTGTIDLDVHTRVSVLSIHYGSVDYHIRGKSNVCYIYAGSFGPFYCEDLETTFLFMNNCGSNDCYVYCIGELEVEIKYTGSIYYTGKQYAPLPYLAKTEITGSGKLINLDE